MDRILKIHKALKVLRLTRHSLIVLLLLSSCDSSMVFETSENLKGASWGKNNALVYQVNITDTTGIHTVLITTRNLGSYKYSNLFLFIHTTSPTGAQLIDTLEISLADAGGRWKGSGLGDLYYLRTPWRSHVRFPYPGVYSFSITQGMREDELKGIGDVGIRIEKAN
jgi:gliding motility-associated lipoprotein GldH